MEIIGFLANRDLRLVFDFETVGIGFTNDQIIQKDSSFDAYGFEANFLKFQYQV